MAAQLSASTLSQYVLHLQITLDTRDILIEATATDLSKAKVVLATLCTMFSEHCSTPFEIEPVEVVDAAGNSQSKEAPQLLLSSRVEERITLGTRIVASMLIRGSLPCIARKFVNSECWCRLSHYRQPAAESGGGIHKSRPGAEPVGRRNCKASESHGAQCHTCC